MKALKITVMTILTMSVMSSALAKTTCYTPRMSKKIVITDKSVAISKPFLKELGERAVASTTSVRTKLVGSGFEKVIFSNGNKHTVHIEDKSNFSQVDDYLLIKSKEGHEMIYPLTCE